MKESSKPLKILLAKTRFCSKRVIVQLHCCILLFTAHALERYHIFFTVINHFHIFQTQPANKMEQILINLRLQSSSTERCTRKFCFFLLSSTNYMYGRRISHGPWCTYITNAASTTNSIPNPTASFLAKPLSFSNNLQRIKLIRFEIYR